MKDIPVPVAETVPLDSVATGVVGLRVLFVNVFAVRGADGWALIDAGLYGSAGRIIRWARAHFGEAPPQSIILTHAHFDHVGALECLVDRWKVPVYAHREEIPYVVGARSYPRPDTSVGRGLMARMSKVYPRRPIEFDGRVNELPADGSVPGLPDWRWIHTPGHTPGHISLFRDVDQTLIVGDAFCTTNAESFLSVATQKPDLHGPPAYFTTDWEAARDSVRRLSELSPEFIAPGHGQPMHGDVTRRALSELALGFDEFARPEKGWYVAHPVRQTA
jgi:glyoxylase-like metal-dependent hydrolase (beta-lactamase superfamily II)